MGVMELCILYIISEKEPEFYDWFRFDTREGFNYDHIGDNDANYIIYDMPIW